MRISDWSSDVCSSDLRQGIVGFSQGACLASHFIWRSTANMAFLGSLTGSLPGFELPTTPVEPRFTGLTAIFTGGLDDDWVKAEHVRATAERIGQIGRAARRESGGLNVEIRVVAVSIKKK